MSVTDIVLALFSFLLLAYAVYDEFLMGTNKGVTRLKVNLRRRNKLDCIIFIGLLAILLYNNINAQGTAITNYLLIALALIAFYISFIRWPKMLFKETGFFYANAFITYDRIKAMNLSEDGILVIELEQRKLLIRVNNMDDLEKIYTQLT
ncbi:inner membrane protein [Enterobacterales bacterium]|nr:inner membrane protein [Enterobacterales bacterium]